MDDFLGVWQSTDAGATIQVLGMHSIIQKQRLASGEAESATGTVKVGRMVNILGI